MFLIYFIKVKGYFNLYCKILEGIMLNIYVKFFNYIILFKFNICFLKWIYCNDFEMILKKLFLENIRKSISYLIIIIVLFI